MDERKILIICDEDAITRYIREHLSFDGGFSTGIATSGHAGLAALERNAFDVIIVTFGLADLDNRELVSGLKKIDEDCVIIVFVEEVNPELLQELLSLGVYDFITRPIDPDRLCFLVKQGQRLHSLLKGNHTSEQGLQEHSASLEKQNILLAKRIEESSRNLMRLYDDLRSTYMRTIKVLAQTIDARDHCTHSHSENVARYAASIAKEMGLPAKDIEIISEACELHDLGKIGIEDAILSKPTQLTEAEWVKIKLHPATGAHILEPLSFLKDVVELVRQHHEHYDGSGYAEGRHGEDILLGARIIHLADAYDSMRSARPYRTTPFSKEEAIAEIKKNTSAQFDPKVVEAFLRVVDTL